VACSSEKIMCHIIFSEEQAIDYMTTCEQATGHPHVSCTRQGQATVNPHTVGTGHKLPTCFLHKSRPQAAYIQYVRPQNTLLDTDKKHVGDLLPVHMWIALACSCYRNLHGPPGLPVSMTLACFLLQGKDGICTVCQYPVG